MDHGPNTLCERRLHDSVEVFAGEDVGCVDGTRRNLYILDRCGNDDSLIRMSKLKF